MNHGKWFWRLVWLTCWCALFGWGQGITAQSTDAKVWTVLAFDPKGDARDAAKGDAAMLSYRYDKDEDLLWIRLNFYGQLPRQSFEISLAVDNGDDGNKISWWGTNKAFKFDRLVTAWVNWRDNRYQGTIGVADSGGVNAKQFNNLRQDNLQIQ